MSNSPTSGSARQLARKQGLARISAVTLGVGAAGVLGAVAIAVTLPQPVAARAATAAASLTSPRSSASDNRASAGDNRSSHAGDTSSKARSSTAASSKARSSTAASSSTGSSTSQLQAGQAPSTTNNPPVATSAAS